MPATESTWYNMPFMHRVFAVSGVVLTLATIWMFYKDHYRAWKDIQKNTVEMEVKYTKLREAQFETARVQADVARYAIAESEAKAQPIDPAAVLAFKAEQQAELLRLENKAKKTEHQEVKFGVSDQQLTDLRKAADEAAAERAKAKAARAAADANLNDVDAQMAAREALKQAEAKEAVAAKLRSRIVKTLQDDVDQAKINEDAKNLQRKFQSAHVDKAKADLDIAIRDNLDQAGPQKKIDEEVAEFNALRDEYQHLSAHRKELENILKNITAPVDAASKALADAQAAHKRLETTIKEKREGYIVGTFPFYGPGKDILNLPILDAFGSTRKPDTKWSADLLQDYTHAKVRRFDRCTTCHGAMQKSLPGEPTSPLFAAESTFDVVLTPRTPEEITALRAELKKPELDADKNPIPYTVDEYLGIKLADEGLLNPDDVIVKYVEPKSPGAAARPVDPNALAQLPTGAEIQQQVASGITPAASSQVPNRAGLLVADVIEAVDGSDLFGQNRGAARTAATLVDLAATGKPITIRIRRGLPHPYNTHPRLDLFISDSSPHKLSTFACTICHEGQGSATEFKWASHTPNDQIEQERWAKDSNLGWFNNHHWIYPMYPERFTQATCLKCHHDVVELEPSEKFPDAPAAKLMHGYHLIRKYGCYGCHEVNGYDGPSKRVGPDLRLEPNFFAVAQQFDFETAKIGEKLDDAKKSQLAEMMRLARELTAHPDNDTTRRRLMTMIDEDAAVPADQQTLPPSTHRLAGMLRDVDAPGTLRKAGPSLRFVKDKVDTAFLYDWIWNPKNFRESTRMPRFFGLTDHLTDHLTDKQSIEITHDLEPIEVRGLVAYLEDRSQTFEPLARPSGIDEWSDKAMIGRGKELFETRGCLACHTHNDFPDTAKFRTKEEIVQGPDLSNIGQKFSLAANPKGPSWLYSWIKEPTKYHPRTVMPNLYLEPLQVRDLDDVDAQTKMPKVKWADPAEDITTYLLSDNSGKWKPVLSTEKLAAPLAKAEADALRSLTIEYLNEPFFKDDVERSGGYYETGLPESMRSELKGAETELITADGKLTDAQRLRYIGLKTVSKYGCYGCHDIPGFEDAKPIGTQLQNWGRKDPSRLAFEHITHYIEHGHGAKHGHGKDDHAKHDSKPVTTTSDGGGTADSHDQGVATGNEPAPKTAVADHDEMPVGFEDYYESQLGGGSRIGFIYQKLKEPRSYDYDKTLNKRFNERLRMPQFPFSAADREAVITFVLGLVAEPPREKYLYRANPRAKAIADGKIVLEKFNCGGCHILEADKWKLSFTPGTYDPQAIAEPVYPFLQPHFSPAELAKSGTPDASNLLHAQLSGILKMSKETGLPEIVNEENDVLSPDDRYNPQATRVSVEVVKPTTLAGGGFLPGLSSVSVVGSTVTNAYTGQGGMLTRYLQPRVTQMAQDPDNVFAPGTTGASGVESYGWLPPPLYGEGNKVQSNWLYEFLLEPYPIRPAVFLRMPKFSMSRDDATKLVNYFAAVDNANYPYEASEVRQDSRLAERQAAYEKRAAADGNRPNANRLDDAMKIVINKKSFCAQCHIIADFQPDGQGRNRGPNLADVYRRLRPEYLRDWIANPKMILPYTGMPVNFGYEPHVQQHSKIPAADFVGDGEQAVDALVDLLMNFDHYSKQKNLIAPQIPQTMETPAGETPAAPAAATQN